MPRGGSGSDRQVALDLFWSDLVQSLGLLTRIPAGCAPQPEGRSLVDAMRAFPVVGLLLGLILGITFGLCQWLGFSLVISAIITVAIGLFLTGGFHEDGLADTADGLGGGTSREGRLAIMRDSRLGTYGAMALILALAARIAALAEIGDFGTANVILILAAAGGWSRALMVQLLASTPNARSDGLSAGIGRPTPSTARQAMIFGLVPALTLVGWSLGSLTALVPPLAAFLAYWLVRRLANRHIGGQTGDIAGAVQQVSEVVYLLALTACLP